MGLTHIYVASAVGIALVISIISCNQSILKSDKIDYNMLRHMLMIVGVSCFFDAVVFTADGRPGALCRIANIVGNTVSYHISVPALEYFCNLPPVWQYIKVQEMVGNNLHTCCYPFH